jgi:acyl carrier protein
MSNTPLSTDEDSSVADGVLAILAEVLQEPVISFVDHPQLGAHECWDSMGSLEVLCQLEGQFGVRLDLRGYHAVRTVYELVTLIEDVKAGRR